MPDPVESRLAALPALSKEALSDLWKQFFNSTPPTQLRRNLMISILAYRIQERIFTPLNGRVRSRLVKLAHAFETNADVKSASMPRLRPGTRLVRQWGNQVHLVNVESHGFDYKGGRYKSLSEIARLITGTRWSGPLFFGIKNEQTGSKSKEAQ